MQKMQEFKFGALWFGQEVRHSKILGAFNRTGALVTVRLASGECEWRRHGGETAKGFETRVTNDIFYLTGLAHQTSIDSEFEQATQAAE
jgi:hypothetical protein